MTTVTTTTDGCDRARRRGFFGRLVTAVLSVSVLASAVLVGVPGTASATLGTQVSVGSVAGADGPTPVPVALTGFDDAPRLVAVVRVPDGGGSLTVDPDGLDVELEYGFDSWSARRTIAFRGDTAAVTTALAGRLTWNPPLTSSPVELSVTVSEYAAGTFFNSGNGHYYEPVISSSAISWTAARNAAAAKSRFGMTGYLATPTSRAENDFLSNYVAADNIWIGANDEAVEGDWRWVTGPEAGTPFWSGVANGSRVSERFSSWGSGEPNNTSNEDYAGTNFGNKGKWNDFQVDNGAVKNYLVEYGGLEADAPSARRASTTRMLTAAPAIVVAPAVARTGTSAVPVAILMPRITTTNDLVAVLTVPAGGGTLSVDGTGLGLTLEYGYPAFTNQASIGFRGTTANVRAAFADRVTWTAPGTAGEVALSVAVAEHVPDTFYNGANGHYYKAINGSTITFTDAKAAAAAVPKLLGSSAYLATLTSAQENDFVKSYVNGANIWIGASDDYQQINPVAEISYANQSAAEGRWHWVTGPEAGTRFWTGAADGITMPGRYAGWKNGEPNNSGTGEHYVVTNYNGVLGQWNDLPESVISVASYLVEFGGMPGEVSLVQQANGAGTLIALSALAVFQDYAQANTGTAPVADDFAAAGSPSVLADPLLAAVNSALASSEVTDADVATNAGLAEIVSAFEKVLASSGNLGAPEPTRIELARLGVTVSDVALPLYVDVLARRPIDEVDTTPELQAISALVAKVVATADGNVAVPPLTLDDLAALGVSVPEGADIDVIRGVIADHGLPITFDDLADAVPVAAERMLTALEKVRAYADTDAGAAPTAADYDLVVSPHPALDALELAAVNSAMARLGVNRADLTNAAAVGAVIAASRTVLARAADPAKPAVTAGELATIGATTAAGLDADGIALLNESIAAGLPAGVATVPELEALATIVAKLMAGGSGLSLADLGALGFKGVNVGSFPVVLLGIGEMRPPTLAGIARAVADGIAGADAAMALIRRYAETKSGPTPGLAAYVVAGVTGVTGANLAMLDSALAGAGVDAGDADSAEKVQVIVDAVVDVRAWLADDDGLPTVASVDLTTIGADVAAGLDETGLALVHQLLAPGTGVTVASLEVAAGVALRLLGAPTALTRNDLALLGADGVTANNLAAVLAAIDDARPTSTGVLAAVVNAAVEAVRVAALSAIEHYDEAALGTVPTVADFELAGISGVDAGNIVAIDSVLATLTPAEKNTAVKVQAYVDLYAKVFATAADPAYSPALTPEDLARLGIPDVTDQTIRGVILAIGATADDGQEVSPVSALKLTVATALLNNAAGGGSAGGGSPAGGQVVPPQDATQAESTAQVVQGTLRVTFYGTSESGQLHATEVDPTSAGTDHLTVGRGFDVEAAGVEYRSAQVCVPVPSGALPARLSLGEVRLYQVIDGKRLDVTTEADHSSGSVCGRPTRIGRYELGAERVTRRAGEDRFATAVAASAARFRPGVPVVYVAAGSSFPDAVSGGAAIAALGGPVLLVDGGDVPTVLAAELDRLRPGRIVILGGTAAVPATVESQLDEHTDGPVVRLAGMDRYGTAAAAAGDAFPTGARTVYVASGESYADAVGAGAAAAAEHAPLLLVRPGSLPEATRAEVQRLAPERIVVLGGVAAVDDDVAAGLAAATSAGVVRVEGADRYATAAAAATRAFLGGAEVVYLATGGDFADALAGVPASADSGAPLLLVGRDELPQATRAALASLRPRRVVVLGGTGAVSASVLDAVRAQIGAG